MKVSFSSLHPMRVIRRQQSYIAVAVAIYAALWAAGRPVPIGRTLIYTLTLCNALDLMQDRLGFLYNRKKLSILMGDLSELAAGCVDRSCHRH